MAPFDETEPAEVCFCEIYFPAIILGGTCGLITWGINMLLPLTVDAQDPWVLSLLVFLMVAVTRYVRQVMYIRSREKGKAESK